MRTFETFADEQLPVPAQVLQSLVADLGEPGRWAVIGATARDLAFMAGGVRLPRRTTADIDVTIAVQDAHEFRQVSLGDPAGGPFKRVVDGLSLDVVPCGGIETDGVLMHDDTRLTVLGCAEAARHADTLRLPNGAVLPFASLESLAVLKLIAFSERYPATDKDSVDLEAILAAAGEGRYGEETWGDEEALQAMEYDHLTASVFRLGRVAISCFTSERAGLVLDFAAQAREHLLTAWRGRSREQLDAWLAGLSAEATGLRSGPT